MLVSRLFNTDEDAAAAVSELKQVGFREVAITTIDKTSGEASKESLMKAGVTEARAQSYADSINQGKTLVILEAPVGTGPTAKEMLERSRPGDSGEHPAEYEFTPIVAASSSSSSSESPSSLAAPLSARMNWPVLLDDPAPLSKWLGWRTLSAPPTAKSTSHGLPFLSDDPTPLSTKFGWKVLSSDPAPFSTWTGRKVLSDDPTPLSTRLGQKVLSDDPAPLSTKAGWRVLLDNPTPLSSWLGWKVLTPHR